MQSRAIQALHRLESKPFCWCLDLCNFATMLHRSKPFCWCLDLCNIVAKLLVAIDVYLPLFEKPPFVDLLSFFDFVLGAIGLCPMLFILLFLVSTIDGG